MNNSSNSTHLTSSNSEDFYLAFENLYRGSTESIQARQAAYLPYVTALQNFYPMLNALDLGCGRGEWLGLLKINGVVATGIDLNDAMLANCMENQLDVRKQDAVSALKELEDSSLQIITGFHIAEHLPFDQLIELSKEAHRVLSPGGLFILETPNSENVHVACSTFYLDPTHTSPLPAKLLSFLFGYCGFEKTLQLSLNPDVEMDEAVHMSLLQVLMTGVGRDYALIGQKASNISDIDSVLDTLYSQNISTLEEVSRRFDLKFSNASVMLQDQQRQIQDQQRQIQDQQRRVARLETPLRFLKKIFSPILKK